MECRAYAEHLKDRYQIDVLTTCALDYVDWKNYYPKEETEVNGVHVIRFPNDRTRDQGRFGEVTVQAYAPGHDDAIEEKWIDEQGPFCPKAVAYLKEHAQEYHAVLFMTYLYYLTARGLVPEMKNAILIPTAHDEPPIHLRYFKKIFDAPQGIIYNTSEEKEFVEEKFPSTVEKPSCTVGYGIEVPDAETLPDVKAKYHLDDYIVYAGRIDESKGCGYMFSYFMKYKEHHPSGLKLVLCGKAAMPVPEHPDIIPLGFVSEEDKYGLMKDAQVLVLASHFESLSIVVLEAMMMGTPVLVNGACAVLKGHCFKSNAGLFFTNYTMFERALTWLLTHPAEYAQMQKNGKAYVTANYQWPHVAEEISNLIEKVAQKAEEANV